MARLVTIDKVSAAHRIGEHRRYVRYLLGSPQIRPPGCDIELIARGTSVQKMVCQGTSKTFCLKAEMGLVEEFVALCVLERTNEPIVGDVAQVNGRTNLIF